MAKDNLIESKKPATFIDDPIFDMLGQGAKKLLDQVLGVEVEIILNQYKALTDERGRQRVDRNGVPSIHIIVYSDVRTSVAHYFSLICAKLCVSAMHP